MGIAWNPWVRRVLGIPDIDINQEIKDETCSTPSDIFGAAELMKSRVAKYLIGGHNSVNGLVSTAPSDFLGDLICDLFVYKLIIMFAS